MSRCPPGLRQPARTRKDRRGRVGLVHHVESHREVDPPFLIVKTLLRLADPQVDLVDAIVDLMRVMAGLHRNAPARMRALAADLREGTSPAELDMFVADTTRILSERSGRSQDSLRTKTWLACVAVTHVGRAVVHDPPDVELEELLEGLGRMLRGLFADLR